LFLWKGNVKRQSGTGFFVHHTIVSAVQTVEFVSDRLSYIALRSCWFTIIVLNVQAPSEEKRGGSKDSFMRNQRSFFYHFLKYHMEIILEDFNAKVGTENIFKPAIGNESLHDGSNDNGVKLVKFATRKNLVVYSTLYLHRNIHNYN
jgi:hypothetical protein